MLSMAAQLADRESLPAEGGLLSDWRLCMLLMPAAMSCASRDCCSCCLLDWTLVTGPHCLQISISPTCVLVTKDIHPSPARQAK